MAYDNPTTINASKGIGEVLTYTNNVSDNWLGNFILIAVFVVVWVSFGKAKSDYKGSTAVAGFITFIVGLLFWLGGFVTGMAFGVTIALAIVGVLVLLLDN
jgi:hypothetical protein